MMLFPMFVIYESSQYLHQGWKNVRVVDNTSSRP